MDFLNGDGHMTKLLTSFEILYERQHHQNDRLVFGFMKIIIFEVCFFPWILCSEQSEGNGNKRCRPINHAFMFRVGVCYGQNTPGGRRRKYLFDFGNYYCVRPGSIISERLSTDGPAGADGTSAKSSSVQ